MTLVRWNPLRDVTAWHPVTNFIDDFTRMHNEIDRIFDRMRGGVQEDDGLAMWMPAVDIIEGENDFRIKVELPGVDKKDVKITINEGVLTVRGEKKKEEEKKSENFHRVERIYGSFQRSFSLPSSVNSEKIDASYKEGILTISIPKAEETKPKEIEVSVK